MIDLPEFDARKFIERACEFIKEKVVKYAKYIGSLNEAIYLTRIDAIQMFENA